ncbi:MAG: hypothetical protein K0T99_04015 [Alphaproteobacteria bacterium]|nr:hypothetical protein [Alphaproteobacteria bacterium]
MVKCSKEAYNRCMTYMPMTSSLILGAVGAKVLPVAFKNGVIFTLCSSPFVMPLAALSAIAVDWTADPICQTYATMSHYIGPAGLNDEGDVDCF